jgi:DNA primase
MTLSPAFLDELRARTVLSAVIAPSVKLIRAGREWKACCPFHNEKTPSFTVNDDKGFYHCFGCGAHGDAIRFLIDNRGMQFMDAVKELAAKAGLDVPAPDPRAQERAERTSTLTDVMAEVAKWYAEQLQGIGGADAREYLKRRGIDSATVQRFGIGLAPDSRTALKRALERLGEDKLVETGMLIKPEEPGKETYDRFRGRLMIPIRDARGRVIAFGGRILGEGEPKYLNSPDTPLFDKGRTLYNIDRASPASRSAKRLIVVEGYMDVIALDRAGIAEAVAPNGTAVTEAQLERMWRLDPSPILCFDGDSAGRKAAIRAALRALPLLRPDQTLRFIELPMGQDPDDIIKSGGREAFEELLKAQLPLSDLIFKSQFEVEPLDTPESRAGFAKRLRDLARTISDEAVRVQYLAFFNGLISEMFEGLKGGSGFSPKRDDLKQRRLPPEMLAIAKLGLTQAVEVRVVLQGLRRYPDIISQLAEPIASIWIKDRGFAQLREAMLDAALAHWPLDSEKLETILAAEGFPQVLNRLRKPFELRYSFLHGSTDSNRGRSDLIDVVEAITTGANIQAEIKKAQRRYAEADGDAGQAEAYDDLERLTAIRAANEERFIDYREKRETSEETY